MRQVYRNMTETNAIKAFSAQCSRDNVKHKHIGIVCLSRNRRNNVGNFEVYTRNV